MIDYFTVWTYSENYPDVFEIDVKNLTPENVIKVKEFEEYYLPRNLYMHKSMKEFHRNYIFRLHDNENLLFYDDKHRPILMQEQEFKASEVSERDVDQIPLDDTYYKKKEWRLRKIPKIPAKIVSSKIIEATKSKGSTIEEIKKYVKKKYDEKIQKFKTKLKKKEEKMKNQDDEGFLN